MSQVVRDLPDPLDPSPSLSTSDPDDLLAQMADEAIDRLIADADNGRPPVFAPPAPIEADAPKPPAPAVPVEGEIEDDDPDHPPGAEASGIVVDEHVVTIDPAEAGPKPAVVTEPADATTVDEALPASAHTPDVLDEPAPPVDVPTPAADRQVLLAEPAERPSVLLLPLWLLNWPFAWIGDNARRVFGLIGIVTLVPALAAIVYVLWLKQRWGG